MLFIFDLCYILSIFFRFLSLLNIALIYTIPVTAYLDYLPVALMFAPGGLGDLRGARSRICISWLGGLA